MTEKDAPPAEMVSRVTKGFEHSMEYLGDAVWQRLRHRPYVGVALTTGAALWLGSLVGVGELAFACLVGYGMFKILRRHEPPSQVFRDVARVEKELGL